MDTTNHFHVEAVATKSVTGWAAELQQLQLTPSPYLLSLQPNGALTSCSPWLRTDASLVSGHPLCILGPVSGFWPQASALHFSDRSKVAYIISLLAGRARHWGMSFGRPLRTICLCVHLRWGRSLRDREEDIERQRDREEVWEVLHLPHGDQSVYDYANQFRDLPSALDGLVDPGCGNTDRRLAEHKPQRKVITMSSPIRAPVSCFPGPSELVSPMLSGNHFEDTFFCWYIFDLIDSPQNPLVLGYRWLVKHNPEINWAKTTILKPILSVSLLSLCFLPSTCCSWGTQGLSRPVDCSWRIHRSEATLQQI